MNYLPIHPRKSPVSSVCVEGLILRGFSDGDADPTERSSYSERKLAHVSIRIHDETVLEERNFRIGNIAQLSLGACVFEAALRELLHVCSLQIQLHSATDEKLHNYIPKAAIPRQDYENLFESSERLVKGSVELLDEYQGWFADDERLARTDESKRIKTANPNKMNKGASFFKSFIGGRSD